MRVAVHHPARTEPAETEEVYERDPKTGVITVSHKTVKEEVEVPESVAAFRMGRIDDFVNPITGETTPKDVVAAKLLADAKAEYPDCEVVLEELHDNGDGTSAWVPVGTAAAPQAPGETVAAPEQVADQSQAAQGGAPQ